MPTSTTTPAMRSTWTARETATPPGGEQALRGLQDHLQLIEQSHQRCAALGLSRIERPDHAPLLRGEMLTVRDSNQRLFTHALPVMELLAEQIVSTQSMVLLTDANGTILHSIGEDNFLERASKVALSPGVNWAEQSKGTNAIGTALIEETPTLVHADEHFMHANNFLTCSAAPILDPRGNILGVLDVSGDRHSYHQHTMGLVKMSARMIENHWLSDDFRNELRLHFHSRAEFIGTLMEGILAVNREGRILGANRSALDQLQLSSAALRMQSITSLFGTSVAALVDHFRTPLSVPLSLSLANGRKFHAQARFNWPVWHAVSPSAARAPAPEPAGTVARAAALPAEQRQRPSGLRYLQTGDAQMEQVIAKIGRVLNRDIPILILGETGTGKELLARAIHQDSQRSAHPFVAVNCASIPESLIEAELFGYEDGAFTGARRKGAVGKIVQANGGTLFLDEIGDMPPPLQARLLRVLQERQVTPLGSSKSIAVDVAIVGATHRNLREMISSNDFREDLYYRLNGLVVKLPALRERSDLQTIVHKILRAECPEQPPAVSAEVMQMFQRYSWPGNVRQLANVLRTAAVMAGGEPLITRAHLSDDFLEDVQRLDALAAPAVAAMMPSAPGAAFTGAFAGPAGPSSPFGVAPPAHAAAAPAAAREGMTLEELEIETIRQAVEAAGGNISEASKRLGISRNTIYRKLRWNRPPAA
ncbi:sigma-54-dependent Fis family transcriptional regulator [Caldimonas tepidiphila]|uniref:sigma-54-dependent Fis family transcriptional regulator n=1 Tax=Caldimonas tepidiphila TaxID=2315841 RepID=UPI001F0CC93F|nr:sigma-54-dependent Fis family transcriptional regulator [Caldimonas tepidiphila]